MTTANVVFRPSTRVGHFEGSLALRLIRERSVKEITLRGCKLYPEEWDKATKRIIYPEGETSRIAYLKETDERIFRELGLINVHLSELEKQGRYKLCDLAKIYRKPTDDSKLLGYVEMLALEKERDDSKRTAEAYRSSSRALVRFNKGVDIPLEHINKRLIKDFEKHLIKGGKTENTISYYMRNLRAIFNRAILDNRIVNYSGEKPFVDVFTGVAKTIKRSLEVEEVNAVKNIDFSEKIKNETSLKKQETLSNLHKAQLYFLFCVFARGMSFVDMAYLKKSDIKGDMLSYVRKKTGGRLTMKITGEMKAIIDSFADEVTGSSYIFPILDENKGDIRIQYLSALRVQNVRLKILAGIAEVNKPVATHWARHSWATIAKHEEIPLHVICECMGHSSEKITEIYLGSLNNTILDAANDKISLAITKSKGFLSLGQHYNAAGSHIKC